LTAWPSTCEIVGNQPILYSSIEAVWVRFEHFDMLDLPLNPAADKASEQQLIKDTGAYRSPGTSSRKARPFAQDSRALCAQGCYERGNETQNRGSGGIFGGTSNLRSQKTEVL